MEWKPCEERLKSLAQTPKGPPGRVCTRDTGCEVPVSKQGDPAQLPAAAAIRCPWRAKKRGVRAKCTAAEGGHGAGGMKQERQTPIARGGAAVLHNGNNTPKKPPAQIRCWQQGWHQLPPALPVVPLLFPTTCHFWERWMGRCWPGSLPTSPPPPHVPVGASTKPPPPLGHPALPPPPPRVAGVPISGDGRRGCGGPGQDPGGRWATRPRGVQELPAP